jgi:hypothetical protein
MNHRFKLATDWKPQHLPELINTIHGIIKVNFADLQRALYGMGNFELHEHFKRHYMQYYLYSSKTSDEKGQLFSRLLADRHLSIHKVISSDDTHAVGKVAKKTWSVFGASPPENCCCQRQAEILDINF